MSNDTPGLGECLGRGQGPAGHSCLSDLTRCLMLRWPHPGSCPLGATFRLAVGDSITPPSPPTRTTAFQRKMLSPCLTCHLPHLLPASVYLAVQLANQTAFRPLHDEPGVPACLQDAGCLLNTLAGSSCSRELSGLAFSACGSWLLGTGSGSPGASS